MDCLHLPAVTDIDRISHSAVEEITVCLKRWFNHFMAKRFGDRREASMTLKMTVYFTIIKGIERSDAYCR
mgnify:CR=1 FL=1